MRFAGGRKSRVLPLIACVWGCCLRRPRMESCGRERGESFHLRPSEFHRTGGRSVPGGHGSFGPSASPTSRCAGDGGPSGEGLRRHRICGFRCPNLRAACAGSRIAKEACVRRSRRLSRGVWRQGVEVGSRGLPGKGEGDRPPGDRADGPASSPLPDTPLELLNSRREFLDPAGTARACHRVRGCARAVGGPGATPSGGCVNPCRSASVLGVTGPIVRLRLSLIVAVGRPGRAFRTYRREAASHDTLGRSVSSQRGPGNLRVLVPLPPWDEGAPRAPNRMERNFRRRRAPPWIAP